MSAVHGGPGYIVQNGLVLHLDAANRNSFAPPYNGTIWRDLSGNGFNGTFVNGTSFNNTDRGVIVFDGIDDYINFGNVLTPTYLGHRFTIEVWFNITTIVATSTSQNRIISYYDSYVLLYDNTTLTLQLFQSTGYAGTSTSRPTSNMWNQLIGIYDGQQAKIYINGTLRASSNVTGNLRTDTSVLNIGAFQGVLNYLINGKMGPVRMYNRGLSDSEILQNYNATRPRFGI